MYAQRLCKPSQRRTADRTLKKGAKTPTTIAELAAEYLEREERLVRHGELRDTTVMQYRQQLNDYILPAIGSMQAVDVRTRVIDAVVDSNDLRSTNRNRCIGIMRGLLDIARKDGLIHALPTDGATRHRPGKVEEYLSLDEHAAVGAACRDLEAKGGNPIIYDCLRALMLTGWPQESDGISEEVRG